jgi:hypothetical protein
MPTIFFFFMASRITAKASWPTLSSFLDLDGARALHQPMDV